MIIKRPIISEKTVAISSPNKKRYTFEVELAARKPEIKLAVEKLFKVTVARVQTIHMTGKGYRTGKRWNFKTKADWKKAIVTLKEGQKIDELEVVGAGENK